MNIDCLLVLGIGVANYAAKNLHLIVQKQEAFAKEDYKKALQDGFVGTDTALLKGNVIRNRVRKIG